MSWFSRVVNVVRRNRVNRDLDDEIQFHLDARTDQLVRGGMAADEARREAQRLFGLPALRAIRVDPTSALRCE